MSAKIPKKESLIKKWIRESFIIFVITSFADFIYNSISKSMTGKLFTGYGDMDEAVGKGFFGFLRDKLNIKMRIIIPLKRFIQRSIDKSLIINLINKKAKHLLCYPIKVYGIFLISFGLYSAVAYIIGRYALKSDIPISTFIFGVAAVLGAVPALFSDKTLSMAICQSAAVNLIVFNGLGIKKSTVETSERRYGRTYVAFILGMLLGILSYFISPLYIVLGLAFVIGVYMILSVPESGVVIILAGLPFLPTMLIAGLIVLVFISYFIKLMRGKRTVKLELMDGFVIFFMTLVFFGGVFSVSPSVSIKPAALYICFMLGYFLVVNLLRSEKHLKCAIGAVAVSSLIVSAYGIIEYLTGIASTLWQDEEMFGDISGRVVSTFGNPNVLAEYLLMVIPIAMSGVFLAKKASGRFTSFVMFAISALCLVLTWSRGAWLGFIFGVLVFMLICSRKTMILIVIGLFSVPFLPFVLPQSIINRFASIGNLADSSTAYRIHIWEASVEMIRDFFYGGLGSGTGTFTIAYPQYTLAGIESAPHSHSLYLQIMIELGIFGLLAFLAVIFIFAVSQFSFYSKGRSSKDKLLCAAGFSGIAAVLLQGATDYIWYNYRIFLMFWLMIGLITAVRRVSLAGERENEIDLGTYIDIPIN